MDGLFTLLGNSGLRTHAAKRRAPLLASLFVVFALLSACGESSSTTGTTPKAPTGQVVATPSAGATATHAPAAPRPASPTATSTPAPKPTATPHATTPPAAGVNGNPWGYDFNSASGKLIYSPPAAFCTYFSCISSFWDGKGYVVQCHNGDFSKSGGHTGVCSKQGGFERNLYAH